MDRTAIGKIVEGRTKAYADELAKMSLTKKTRLDLEAGFQDGMGNAIATLRAVVRLDSYVSAFGGDDAVALDAIIARVAQCDDGKSL